MTDWTSLFAQELRAHRVRSGTHGRMTQDALAAALDVSVDAISKYERSLSYIRGDLEYKLIDTLGWSKETVLACRQDWEAGRPKPEASSYRLMNNNEALRAFGGSAAALTQAVAGMETDTTVAMPGGFSAADAVWENVQSAGRVSGPYVLQGSELVGHIGLVFPDAIMEKQFYEGRFDEGALTPDRLKRPLLPGAYFAYCPAIYVARGHEAAARLLLSGFVAELEELAACEVIIRDIGAISVNALGRQLCEDVGLRFHGAHALYAGFGVWTLAGSDIAGSILGRRSLKLKQVYGARSGRD